MRAPCRLPHRTSRERPAADTDLGAEDADAAVTVVDAYRTAHRGEFFTGTYTSPRVSRAYDPRARDNPAGCGPLTPQNALYCPNGDFLGWDAGLIRKADELGDSVRRIAAFTAGRDGGVPACLPMTASDPQPAR